MIHRGYGDIGYGRKMGLKRQRLMDQDPPYSNIGQQPPFPVVHGCEMGLKRQRLMDKGPPLSYIGQQPPFPVVRLRGLPFDCSEADIVEFFHGLDIVDVLLVRKNDKFTGKAFCVLAYPLQVDFALQRNKQNIGRRYVEISRSKRQTYYKAIANEVSDSQGCAPHRSASRAKSSDTWVLLLKGLPFSAGKDDIMDFFNGFVLSENLIHITATSEGKPTGEAFVEFASEEDSKAAMERDGMTLGNRYIELFPSSHEDLNATVSRGRFDVNTRPKSSDEGNDSAEPVGVMPKSSDEGNDSAELEGVMPKSSNEGNDSAEPEGVVQMRGLPNSAELEVVMPKSSDEGNDSAELEGVMPKSSDEGNNSAEPEAVMRMRGLPYTASKDDVLDFFKDFVLLEDSIHFTLNRKGRPTGEAFVGFASAEDSKAAMAKNRMTIGSRYIELFASSLDELNEALSRGR
ncbi:uncharacterized protein LOC130791968 isoform X1 [Actinidia eriantha]|uniref:uncharacterized protein LOC130791968 isoform X1 n=1 Tax=Actinidia eriantha TaxID=165200 RepID=UPI00258E6EBA|nr:uncharacterized protein LOC130791968 isoform X1 [Actinidia eriantha]